MAETRQGPHDGISGWQAKLVALWTMVADHVGLIGIGASATGVMGATYLALRIAGRVSYRSSRSRSSRASATRTAGPNTSGSLRSSPPYRSFPSTRP